MEDTYYHGTRHSDFDATSENPEFGRFDLCLTPDADVALEYAEDHATGEGEPVVHSITIAFDDIADEEEVVEIVEEVFGIEVGEWDLFNYIDTNEVQEALVAAGFRGCYYQDASMGGELHDTLRIFDPSIIVA